MRLRLLAPVLLLTFGAGCSAGVDAPNVAVRALDVVRAAADNTAKGESARFTMEAKGDGVALTASGVTELGRLRGTLDMTMRVQGQVVEFEMRMLDDLLYMKAPALGAPKPWMKIDVAEAAASNDTFALAQVQQSDPTQSLSYLDGISDDVREVGKEDVRGVPTTKYEGTVDLHKARDNQPKERVREAIQTFIDQAGIATFPMTVWIDAEGRMRRASYVLDMTKATKGQFKGPVTTTLEMYDFGVPVDVTAPPAGEVMDVTDLAGRQ